MGGMRNENKKNSSVQVVNYSFNSVLSRRPTVWQPETLV